MTLFDQIAIAIFVGWYAGNELYRRWPDLYSQLRHRVSNVRLSLENLGSKLGPLWWPFGNHGDWMERSYANTLPPGPKEINYKKERLIKRVGQMHSCLPYLTDHDFYAAAYLVSIGTIDFERAATILADLDHARGDDAMVTIMDLVEEFLDRQVELLDEEAIVSLGQHLSSGMVTAEEATNALSAMAQAMRDEEPEVLDITTKGDAGRVYCLRPQPEEGYR